MLSLEKARALKEVGLAWEPKEGDWLFYDQKNLIVLSVQECNIIATCGVLPFAIFEYQERALVWLPRLSQLLAEIELHGYTWEIGLATSRGGSLDPGVHKSGYWCEAFKGGRLAHRVILAETREDAAAEVLLMILKEAAMVRDETVCGVGSR